MIFLRDGIIFAYGVGYHKFSPTGLGCDLQPWEDIAFLELKHDEITIKTIKRHGSSNMRLNRSTWDDLFERFTIHQRKGDIPAAISVSIDRSPDEKRTPSGLIRAAVAIVVALIVIGWLYRWIFGHFWFQ